MTDPRGKRSRPSALGRGLGALLGDVAGEQPTALDAVHPPGIRLLPVASLSPHPDQPRRHFDEAGLDELAESIAARGLIQPIVVRPHGHDYQIVAGERRWRAAQRARLHEVPVVVRTLDEAQTLEIALLENIQRQDLNAIEEAQGYARLVADFGHTQEALGRIVHKSRSHVANLLRLLDLPAEVQQQVIAGELSMGHARALLTAPDPTSYAQQVVSRGLSVRDTEKLVRGSTSAARERQPRIKTIPDADLVALEHQLADLLGVNVRIVHDDKGGTLSLTYTSLDQLDMLCQRLSGDRL